MSRTVEVRLKANVSQFTAGLAGASRAAKQAADEIKAGWTVAAGAVRSHTEELDRLGTGMLKAGAMIGVGLGAAMKAAMSWESAFAGVRKTVDELDPAFASLEGQLRHMSRTMATSHEDIAAVAEEAGALGVSTGDVAEFTRQMVILGETTNVSAEQAATSMAQFMTIMGTAPERVGNLAAALVDLGNNGASTEAQILDMSQRIAGAGRAIGLTEAQVMGFASAIASTGMNVEAGGSAISRVFTKLDRIVTDGGRKLKTISDLVGTDFASAFRTDASAAVTHLIEALGRLQARGGSVTGVLDDLGIKQIYETDVIRRLAGAHDLLADQLDMSGQAMDRGAAHLDEYAKRAQTTEFKTSVAWNNIKDAAIEAGNDMLPIVAQAAEQVADLAQTFHDVPGPVRSAGVSLAGTAAAALLLGGGITKGTVMVSNMIGSMGKLGLSAGKAKLALGGLGLALSAGAIAYGLWADAAAQAERNAEDFAATLVVIDGKVTTTSATFDSLNNKLVTTKTGMLGWGPTVYDLMERLGVSASMAQQYILGVNTSTERLLSTMGRGDGATDLVAGLTAIRESMTEAEKQALQKAIADQTAGAEAAGHADSMREEAGAARSAEAAMSSYTDGLLAAGNANLTLRGNHRAFEAAIDAAAAAVKRNGKTLDDTTKKGRDNGDALDAIAASGLAVVKSLQDVDAPAEEVRAAMKAARTEFIKAATAMGEVDAEGLADDLKLIPSEVNVTVKTEIDPSGIREWEKWMPKTKVATIQTIRKGPNGIGYEEADGGILAVGAAGRLLRAYAAGGTHLPAIGSQQPRIEHNRGDRGIQWAETGAGPWEGFVSGHPAKRERSRAVTEDIANRLGGDITWRAADGGLIDGKTLREWDDALLTPLETTRLKIRIRDLERDLKAKETYNPKGPRKKAKRLKLRGLDRTEAKQELAELRQELADAKRAAALDKDMQGTLADRAATADLAARYAEQIRARNTSGLSVGTGYQQHQDAAGNTWYSARTVSAGDITAKARREADDLGVLHGKIEALVRAGASRELLDDLLKIDDVEEQIRVADAFLTGTGAIAGQNRAYADKGVWSEKIGKLVAATPVASSASGAAGGGPSGAGTTINITNYYPQAEPTSVTENRARAVQATLGGPI